MSLFSPAKESQSATKDLARFIAPIYCMLWSALAAAAAVVLGEYLINRIYFQESVIFEGQWPALLGNVLILFFFLLILLALTNRLGLAFLLGFAGYGILITADIIKLICLDNPLRPTDFRYLTDLRVVAGPFLRTGTFFWVVAACLAFAGLAIFLWHKEIGVLPGRSRICIGTLAMVLFATFFALPTFDPVLAWINNHGVVLPESYQFMPSTSAQLNGLLVEWVMDTAASPAFNRPEGYSIADIERIAGKHPDENSAAVKQNYEQPVNLIVYLVESFMDPLDLGLRYNADPIPTFHALSRRHSSGRIVVPVFGGTSANTEFEVLTGLSMYFLPGESCPYRQYISEDIPSLPRFLRQQGYRTTAIVADPPYLFNRKAVLGHLGFDRWIFPVEDPGTPRSPDDEFAADSAIADAVIAESQKGSPSFIFAFTGATHFPWDYPDYDQSKLDAVKRLPEPQHKRLKTYINALKVADRSLQKLIAHFEKTGQRTAILIMGDHLPALQEVYDTVGFFKAPELEQIRRRYQVPAVLWSNWPTDKQDILCSANFLPDLLLQHAGLHPTGSLAFSADVHTHFPILSNYVVADDGSVFEREDPEIPYQPILDDYRRLQYDLLRGSQYIRTIPGWGW